MIDEAAHAGKEHLDPEFVAGFDEKQGHPRPDEDIGVFSSHGLDATAIVVDFGAGSGQFALGAARHFGRVIAVDVSPAMLALLEEKAKHEGLENLVRVQAGFLSYEHSGPPADGIYTRNALHQLPDFWKAIALGRMTSWIRPGGLLRIHDLIYDFEPAEAEEVFNRWFESASTEPNRGYTREDFVEHIRSEHSTFRWLFESMLTAAGLDVIDVEFRARVYGSYTCVKA